MNLKVVIFGGSGFIGQALCQSLIQKGHYVISVSRHGKPLNVDEKPWANHPNMTWLAYDLRLESQWQNALKEVDYCVNLIGILTPNHSQTYTNSIIEPNQRISQWAEVQNIPYLFLSARLGPPGYLKAKKIAEQSLLTKTNPIVIVRAGLVVDSLNPLKYYAGLLIQKASSIKLLSHWSNRMYPIERLTLIDWIVRQIEYPQAKSKWVDLTH